MNLSKTLKNLKAAIFIFVLIFFGSSFGFLAADEKTGDNPADLSRQIIEAKSNQDLYPLFNRLQELYFKDNKYAEFAESLKSLSAQKKSLEPFTDYYVALSRLRQLKYLEETQSWDEYFAKGNAYRDEITAFAQKAVAQTKSTEPLHLYSRLLLWQFHKGQEDAFSEEALSNLMQSALDYSKEAPEPEPLKKIADALLSYGEKARARELYKIYIDRLISANTQTEDLSRIASGFYQEGNLELSETVYDIYIDRLKAEQVSKEETTADLIKIARQFTYQDQGRKDPLYAEKIFKKIEEIGGKDVFDAQLMYLRGFNLEKIKDYAHALQIYIDLLKAYPQDIHAAQVSFKIGIIQAYVLRDIEKAEFYFEKSASGETASPYLFSALYQLGLLNQWQGDVVKARGYYNRLIEKTGSDASEIRLLAEERLKEIENKNPIEHNLKMFLDVSLKPDNPAFNPDQVDLKSSAYMPAQAQELNISATAYAGETGCLQPLLEYIWSGDLGEAKPGTQQPHFSTKYTAPGTKIINLVVISSGIIVGRTLDILDVS